MAGAQLSWGDDFAAGGALLGGVERSDGRYLNTLSASAISTLFTCPEKFRRSYLLLETGPTYASLVLGNAYHHALQKNFEQKVYTRQDMELVDLFAAYDEGWGQAIDREVVWRNDDPGATKTLGAEMLKHYMRTLAKETQPIAVEEWFEQAIHGVPIPLVGRIDLLAENPRARLTRARIIDRKTDKSGATKARPEWRVQALCYFAAFPRHDFAWHVQSKGGTLRTYGPDRNPGLVLHNTPGKQRAATLLVQRAWEMLSDFYDRYGLDQPWPGVALAHPYACSSCSYRPKCVWVA